MGKSGTIVEKDEYVTVKVRKHVKEELLRMQGLLQFKEKKRFSVSDLVSFLIANAPELQVPINEGLRVIEPRTKNHPQKL